MMRTDRAGDLRATDIGRDVVVCGWVDGRRDHGGVVFLDVRDTAGIVQVVVDPEQVAGGDVHRVRGEYVVQIEGAVRHRPEGTVNDTLPTGEVEVAASTLTVLSEAETPPFPIDDRIEADEILRLRHRYLDLRRPRLQRNLRVRAQVNGELRRALDAQGFVEVETPILQRIHGGANARPFETHINAYDMDLYLRIATELHLKRLLVGGIEKVFEIGRQFRNEGADATHNPEFTSLEVYQAYGDYDSMRVLTQELVQAAASAVHGRPVARRRGADGRVVEVDLSGEWPVVPVCTAVSDALGEEVDSDTPVEELHRLARQVGVELDPRAPWGASLEGLYGHLCEPTTVSPVFYVDFPAETAPLTRRHRVDPRLAEKWDLVLCGAELATAYSELIDPQEQRARLVAQSLLAAAGDPEAMQLDEDFLQALEVGMPPTGGMGLGLDRLVMSLTGLPIRDTILFPLVRPERGG